MTPTLCITNDINGLTPCTTRGAHHLDCDGWEYQWAEDRAEWLATGRSCRGCEPRTAKHGLLCGNCYDRVTAADASWPALERVLEQYDRLVQAEGGGAAGHESSVPIPATRLAIDEVNSHRRSFTGNIDVWVSSTPGAADAVRFAKAASRALKSFPTTEHAHRVQVMRCPDCELLSLVWTPPALVGETVTIECRNPACTYAVDQDAFDPGSRYEVA